MSRHFIPTGEVHYLKRPATLSKAVATYCGLVGTADDSAFGVYRGPVAEFRAVDAEPKHVTCRRCRKLGGLIIV